ncbi:MAG: hypothetical protein HQM15_09690 [Deltaproteobacteria bacterium]|nr:hypothetical protein [Deltaproteobacteria bacterium]
MIQENCGGSASFGIEIQERDENPSNLNRQEQDELVYGMIDHYRAARLNDLQIRDRMRSFIINGHNYSIVGQRACGFTTPICNSNTFRLVAAQASCPSPAVPPRPGPMQTTPVGQAIQVGTVGGVVQRSAYPSIYSAVLREYDRRVNERQIPIHLNSSTNIDNYYVVSAADVDLLSTAHFEDRTAFVRGLLGAIREHVLVQIRQHLEGGVRSVDDVMAQYTPGASFIENLDPDWVGRVNYYQIVDGAFYTYRNANDPTLVPYRIIRAQVR